MGTVYKAHDPAIDRPVAIKLVRADLLDGAEREDYLARFRREAQAAGRCMHPNIVAVYDFALHEGNPFLAMEYVEGVSLAQALARTGRFGPHASVAVMLQVLAALGLAHSLGIVHRDVKPANILLLPDGRVKMTDFGISRLESVTTTQAGSVLGTPSYMSPEQCRGEPVDARSDLFSAGAVLYELLSGERPFPGRGFTEVTHRVLTEAPIDLRIRLPSISPALAAVVDKALAKRPQDRFASAAEMAEALRQAEATAPTRSPEPDATVVAPPAATAFDEITLTRIERLLTEHVGPIARRLVRDAARRAASAETLVAELARGIDALPERERFVTRALGEPTGRSGRTALGSATRPPTGAVKPAALEQAQLALTRFVGPIARILVRRAAGRARSEAELWELLAAHIDAPQEREDFLRLRPP